MYGNGQVLMSSSPTSMGVAAENVMSSSDHHHHHSHHQHAFFMSSPVRNPNSFNFMSAASAMPSFHPFPSLIPKEEGGLLGLRGGREDIENLSGGDPLDLEVGGAMASGNELDIPLEQDPAPTTGKKKRYHRHTAHQIQEMEALFKECPHPDDKQRMKLSQELGLKPRQVKFWFQNRRTQMKAQHDRTDNVILRSENEGLKTENYRLQALMRSLMCPTCGGASLLGEVAYDEHQIRLENARLKEELDRLCSIASRYSGRPPVSMGPPHPSPPPHALLPPSLELDMGIYSRHFQEPVAIPPSCSDHTMIPMPFLPPGHHSAGPHHGQFQGGICILDEERSLAMDLALSSLDELGKMCQTDEPLWLRSINNTNTNVPIEVLDAVEHSRMFPWAMSAKQHYNVECVRTEATRHTALVIMNSLNLVDAFLDTNKWTELFPSIVLRAKTLQIVASGVSGHASGSLHLMYAEVQLLSPLVPTRETYFLRYCHHNVEAGIWSVVDFPIDNFQFATALQPSLPRYRRRPSGCIIRDMPNGYSRVTWVEHAEILEEKPVHQIFNQYVSSGMAFGAQRWLAVLQRQCERVASQMARNISDLGVIQSPEARKNLMSLAQRMIRMFCANISTTGGQSWTVLSDSAEDTVRITTRKVMEPGQPNGVILSAVSTTWLPYPHEQVFNLLKNEHKRSQLEALSNGNSLQEVAHIANGSDPGNCISLLRINVASNSSQNVDLMLQESCTDSSGSHIVYTTVEVNYIQLVMSGEDPSSIPILPLGFSIIPVSTATEQLDPPSEVGGPSTGAGGGPGGGCLLTVGLQVHASTIPTAKLSLSSVTAINNHLCNAINQINAALIESSSSTCISNNAAAAAATCCPAPAPPPPPFSSPATAPKQ